MITRLALIAALLLGTSAQAAPAFQVYPVKGLFFARGDEASLITEDFRQSDADDQGAYFEKKFREAFPDSAKNIDESNKRRTFAVSLQVARASFFTVPKPPTGTQDVYLPITASLYFTNVMTGEILFAATRTDVPLGTMMDDEVKAPGRPKIRGLFGRYFRELTDELIGEAKEQFHPITTTATVRGEWKGFAILDVGEKNGLAPDDSFEDEAGNELRVIATGPTYCVARSELGKFSKGTKFSRVSNQTLSVIRKPRVMPFIDESPKGLPREALLQIFSDALGAKSPVALIPVNATFADVLKSVSTHADISQEQIRQRELPDLFLRLHVYEPIVFTAPTDKAYRTRRIAQALAFAEVVDRSGRVLFSAFGKSRVQDEIINNMALDSSSRKEIVVKNALVELATKFGTGFTVKRFEAPVTDGSKTDVTLQDSAGSLYAGTSLTILHDIGHIDGIADNVRVPIWEAEAAEAGASVHGKLVLPLLDDAPNPQHNDVAVFQSAKNARPARVRLGPCRNAEKLGALDFSGYEPLMQNLFAAASPAPFYSPGLSAHVSTLVNGGCGFKSTVPLHDPQLDLCVQTVHRIDPQGQDCNDDVCADKVSVRLTYRIRKGPSGDVVTKHGLEANVKATALPSAAPADVRSASLQADLQDEAIELAPQMTKAFADDKL